MAEGDAAAPAIRPAWIMLGLALVTLPAVSKLGNGLLVNDDLGIIGHGRCLLSRGWGSLLAPRHHYRPVREAAFAGLHAAAGGRPWVMHAAQAAVHLAAVAILAGVLWTALGDPVAAGLGAAMFGVGWFHRETVVWFTGLQQVLAGAGAGLALWWLRPGGEAPGLGRSAAATAAFALGFLAYAAFPLMPLALWAWWRMARRDARPPWLAIGLLAAVVAGWAVAEGLAMRGGAPPFLASGGAALPLRWARNLLGALAYVAYPVLPTSDWPRAAQWAGKAVAGLVAGWVIWRTVRRGHPGERWLLVWALAASAPFVFTRVVHERHLYTLAMPWCGLLAAEAVRLWRARPQLRGPLSVVGAGLLLWHAGWLVQCGRAYGAASRDVQRILAGIRDAAPVPPRGARLVLRGLPWEGVYEGIPVRMFAYEFSEALQLLYGDCILEAVRAGEESQMPPPAGGRIPLRFEGGRIVPDGARR